ncbi:hypothetical protein ABZ530_06235 [Micrococcus luteus]|uniref:hypothetical protein n=1 Tax=Micrococcus luteus TaxID=1270 RepID=UPI0033CE0F4B
MFFKITGMGKLPMFNLMKVESMYINSIRDLVINLSENESKYIVINKFVKPLYKVENYYNESISQENFSLNLLYSRDTSADLALEVTNKFPKKRYHYFLYAQNQPDYKSLNSPLAFILEKSNSKFDFSWSAGAAGPFPEPLPRRLPAQSQVIPGYESDAPRFILMALPVRPPPPRCWTQAPQRVRRRGARADGRPGPTRTGGEAP